LLSSVTTPIDHLTSLESFNLTVRSPALRLGIAAVERPSSIVPLVEAGSMNVLHAGIRRALPGEAANLSALALRSKAPNYDVKRLHAMLETQHNSERRFHINPAFWAGLEIVHQPTLV
jgi:hypothetical protein